MPTFHPSVEVDKVCINSQRLLTKVIVKNFNLNLNDLNHGFNGVNFTSQQYTPITDETIYRVSMSYNLVLSNTSQSLLF